MEHPVKKFFREKGDKYEASPGKKNWEIELERLRSDNVSLRVHADNLRDKNRSITVKFEQTENRLAMAIEEIDRLKEENDKYRLGMQENCELRRIAESFREQTRKALAEQYKLSVRITELERERQANE